MRGIDARGRSPEVGRCLCIFDILCLTAVNEHRCGIKGIQASVHFGSRDYKSANENGSRFGVFTNGDFDTWLLNVNMAVIRVPLNVTAECINVTLNMSLLKNSTTNSGLGSKDQQQALYYILAVLGMYSLGVLVMMVKYLKREQKELEEERRLEEFMRDLRHKSAERRAKSKKPTGMTSRLALSALNTVHALSPPNSSKGKVTFI